MFRIVFFQLEWRSFTGIVERVGDEISGWACLGGGIDPLSEGFNPDFGLLILFEIY
ncbi:hypothetical protein [Rossellomorea yichunensis]|uniref:hypothetical protein n=1 Tax=Rossellomorea yichunensis TaxID=3077331 RepID=UPI0028E011A8|nr:hypothetical protein [Rossellomorea sp. YC4-1]MDT9026872.1 hypothetical protein [Rossellomorea sp. YC4-1]